MLLRPGLLAGLTVLAAPRTPATDACAALGATVHPLEADLLDEAATAQAATPAQVLVVDAGPLFGAGGPAQLRAALDGTWSAIRAAGDPTKIVLVAPRPAAGPHAEPVRAGLENLARTLSIEWARNGVRTAAILPGDETSDGDVAEVVAYLTSPAGDYFSGCRLELT